MVTTRQDPGARHRAVADFDGSARAVAEADALARRLFADWMARPRVWPVEADGGWRLYNRALLRWIRRRDARRLRLAAAFGMDAHRYRLRSLAKLQAARGARLSSYERGG